MVASESPEAARAGREVLDAGGNAVDTAVATTFAIGVSQPQSCGIGGGGFMVYRGADGETASLDFREKAPAAITADAFQGDGIYTAYTSHKTVGVPGTVAGMNAALERYGSLGLAETIAPAAGRAARPRGGLRSPRASRRPWANTKAGSSSSPRPETSTSWRASFPTNPAPRSSSTTWRRPWPPSPKADRTPSTAATWPIR